MQRNRIVIASALVAAVVVTASLATVASATAPGKNGQIAFRRYFDAAHESWGAIFTIDAKGKNERQVTQPPRGTRDDTPDWAPDGSRITFERCPADAGCRVATVRPDGSDLQYLTPECSTAPGAECLDIRGPAYSPDGKQIVFGWIWGSDKTFPDGTDQAESFALDIMNADGSGRREILKLGAYEADLNYPQFSPDGKRLVFEQHNSSAATPKQGHAIVVVNVDGTGLQRITPWALRAGDSPDWSPDGKLIAFRSNVEADGKQSQIYVVRPDGTGLKQLTHLKGGTTVLSTSFSPDGKWIVLAATGKGGNADVYVMRANGKGMRPLTRTTLWDSTPDWGTLAG
jgi:Tol biopolymer transport system component